MHAVGAAATDANIFLISALGGSGNRRKGNKSKTSADDASVQKYLKTMNYFPSLGSCVLFSVNLSNKMQPPCLYVWNGELMETSGSRGS